MQHIKINALFKYVNLRIKGKQLSEKHYTKTTDRSS
jgi:hypothetical protein